MISLNLSRLGRIYIFRVESICTVSRVDESIESIDIPSYEDLSEKKPFSLEETYFHLYAPTGFNGAWISDNEISVSDLIRSDDITKYNVVTREKTTIFNGTTLPVRMHVARTLACDLSRDMDINLNRLRSASDTSFYHGEITDS